MSARLPPLRLHWAATGALAFALGIALAGRRGLPPDAAAPPSAELTAWFFVALLGAGIVLVERRRMALYTLRGLARWSGVALLFLGLGGASLCTALNPGRDHLAHVVGPVPADASARDAVSDIWRDVSGGGGSPLVLKVKGRDVEIPVFRNGAGRATFWDLCARPLGPADYLAIAGALRLLVLEGVPRLSSENYNEAKRFVTLIDALYEARVRLVMTAADVPERLYIEGEGAFEFERTASRLREMQGADWAT
jgi:hypothetical protein